MTLEGFPQVISLDKQEEGSHGAGLGNVSDT